MSKQRWNLRIWRGMDEHEVLPWTPAILIEDPIVYDDPDDDPRSLLVIISFNEKLERETHHKFIEWVDASFGAHHGKEKAQKRKYINQCMAALNRGNEFRYLNYVYAEEIVSNDLSFIDPGLIETKLTLAYKSMTFEPTTVIYHKEN